MLVLIDVETTATKVIPASVNDMVVNVRWTTGGTGVFLDLQNLFDQLVVPATGTRAVAVSSPSMRLSPRFDGSTHCAATGDQVEAVGWEGDGGLVLVSASGQETALVTVAGRERGFHDHFATVDRFYFTDDCEYVVFDFDESVWVAEVSSGRVGPITPGRESFQAP